jgi:phosphocarrier protein
LDWIERKIRIVNKRGLHARAAAKFVKISESCAAKITVCKDDMAVCGRSIMGLLMLSAARDSDILIRAEGADAATALDALAALVERRFDEAE